jgi:hypothetical protein
VAVTSTAYVCGRSITMTGGLNPVEEIVVCLLFVVCGVGSGLCDELITQSGESYAVRVWPLDCHDCGFESR